MKLFLIKELSLEEVTRFKLIRERENNCAKGNYLQCDLFREGYFDSTELLDNDSDENKNENENENEKEKEKENDIEKLDENFNQNRNKKSRIKFHDQKKEKQYLHTLNGLQKVKSVICESEHLLPDESPRIFVLLSDYMNFLQSIAGQNFHKKNVKEMQKNTLFGPYLENGEEGYTLAGIVICEMLGIVFSPVIVPLHYISIFLMRNINLLYDNVEVYFNNRILDSPDFNICYYLNNIYIDIQTDNTILFKIFRFLNPYRYSLIMSILDYFHFYYSTPNYIFNLVLQSPYMYYDYYIENKYISLPQRRHACLLRSGIDTAEKELSIMKNKINEEEKKEFDKKNNKIKNKKEKKNARNVKRNKINKNDIKNQNQNVDFGLSDSWESLKNICLQGNFGEYEYNFCFFGKFKQGETVLGEFKNWGSSSNKIEQKNLNEFDDDIDIINEVEIEDEKNDEGGGFYFGGKKESKKMGDKMQNSRSKYNYQIYEDGTVCQGMIPSSSLFLTISVHLMVFVIYNSYVIHFSFFSC